MTQQTITKKQQEILNLIPRFRYLSSNHIQTILNHKDKRRINTWLKQLRELEYIEKVLDDKSDTFGSRNRPVDYRLGPNGIRWLKNQIDGRQGTMLDKKLINNLYRQKHRSGEFVSQCLFLADIYLSLVRQAKTDNSIKLVFYTKADYSSPLSNYSFLQDIRQTGNTNLSLSPEALVIKQTGRSRKSQFLLHIIPESMLRFRAHKLRRTIREYLVIYFTNTWENKTNQPFPTVLFILPDMQVLIYLQRFIQKLLNENNHPKIHFWLATKASIQKHGFTDTHWEEVK